MGLGIRRVVTGFDNDGRAIVQHDDVLEGVSPYANVTVGNIWTTDDFPLAVDSENDRGAVKIPREPPARHSIFRVVRFDPGNNRDMHVTKSIDYAVIISGEIDMELDDGVMVHLNVGDTLVQQATIHGWSNTGTEPCVIAFALISTES